MSRDQVAFLLPLALPMYSVTVGVFIFLGIDNDIPFRFKYLLAVYVEAFVNEVIKCMEFAFKKKIELEGGVQDIDETRLAKH